MNTIEAITSSEPEAAAAPITDEALNKLKPCFEAPRWAKIEAQATKQAINLQVLCAKLLATRAARYPHNDKAALYSACNGLLLSVGSVLKEADTARFDAALKGLEVDPLETPAEGSAGSAGEPSVPAEDTTTPTRKKRGGQADPAPVPLT